MWQTFMSPGIWMDIVFYPPTVWFSYRELKWFSSILQLLPSFQYELSSAIAGETQGSKFRCLWYTEEEVTIKCRDLYFELI